MKTRLISAILACIMLVSLAACVNDKPGKTPDESTAETTEAQTTENVTTEETTEETTEPAAALALNSEVLSDLGMTYPEIAEKRGELIDFGMPSGGMAYIFENGFGYIWSPDDINWNPELKDGDPYPVPPKDENGNYDFSKFSLPNPQVKCYAMITSSADKLFLGLTDSLHISEFEKINGISHIETGESGEYGNYCSVFTYQDKTIAVFTTEKEIITPNSIVTIEMK